MTAKRKIFIDEYLIDLNATRAYKAAYPTCKKDDTARVNGSRLLTNADIAAEVEKRMKDREKRTEITQDKVLQELAKIGFAKITDFLEYYSGNEDGDIVLSIKDSDKIDSSAISEVSLGKDGTFKFKLHNKLEALEKMAKHLNLYSDNDKAGADDLIKNMNTLAEIIRNPVPDRNIKDFE